MLSRQEIIDNGCIPKLVEDLKDPNLQCQAASDLGYVASGTSEHTRFRLFFFVFIFISFFLGLLLMLELFLY